MIFVNSSRNKPIHILRVERSTQSLADHEAQHLALSQALKTAYRLLEESDLFYLPFDFYIMQKYMGVAYYHDRDYDEYAYYVTLEKEDNRG